MNASEWNEWNKAPLENVSGSQVEGKALKVVSASFKIGSKF